jgi:hypothetical protein
MTAVLIDVRVTIDGSNGRDLIQQKHPDEDHDCEPVRALIVRLRGDN